jgi:hypothetical protein
MIIDHCFNILVNGASPHRPEGYSFNDRLMDTLKTGMRIRRLDGLKSALIMVELLRSEQGKVEADEFVRYFDNFVEWTSENLPVEMTLAVVKYAIRDRHISLGAKGMKKSIGWQKLVEEYRPILLVPDEQAKQSPVYRKMMKYADALAQNTKRARDAVDGVGSAERPARRKIADVRHSVHA